MLVFCLVFFKTDTRMPRPSLTTTLLKKKALVTGEAGAYLGPKQLHQGDINMDMVNPVSLQPLPFKSSATMKPGGCGHFTVGQSDLHYAPALKPAADSSREQ